MRYDLQLAFKRMDQVKAEKGYQGPACGVLGAFRADCRVHSRPRRDQDIWSRSSDIEAWLVPLAGTRVLVPFRLSVPTPLGLGVLQATQFCRPRRRAAGRHRQPQRRSEQGASAAFIPMIHLVARLTPAAMMTSTDVKVWRGLRIGPDTWPLPDLVGVRRCPSTCRSERIRIQSRVSDSGAIRSRLVPQLKRRRFPSVAL